MTRLQKFFVVSLVAVFVATLAPAALAESYKFGASKPGGSWYPIGTVLQRLAEKNDGDKVTVEIGGGTSNLLNVMAGKMSFGLSSATSIQEALKGAKMFKGKEAQAKKVRVAAVLTPTTCSGWSGPSPTSLRTSSSRASESTSCPSGSRSRR